MYGVLLLIDRLIDIEFPNITPGSINHWQLFFICTVSFPLRYRYLASLAHERNGFSNASMATRNLPICTRLRCSHDTVPESAITSPVSDLVPDSILSTRCIRSAQLRQSNPIPSHEVANAFRKDQINLTFQKRKSRLSRCAQMAALRR